MISLKEEANVKLEKEEEEEEERDLQKNKEIEALVQRQSLLLLVCECVFPCMLLAIEWCRNVSLNQGMSQHFTTSCCLISKSMFLFYLFLVQSQKLGLNKTTKRYQTEY